MSDEKFNPNSMDAILGGMMEQLKTLNRNVETLATNLRQQTIEAREEMDAISQRVSGLERWRWYLLGAFAAGGIGGGVSAEVISRLIKAMAAVLLVAMCVGTSGCTFRTVEYQTAAGPVIYRHKSFGVRQSIGELRVKEGNVEVSIKGYSNDQAEAIGVAVEKAVSAAIKGVAP